MREDWGGIKVGYLTPVPPPPRLRWAAKEPCESCGAIDVINDECAYCGRGRQADDDTHWIDASTFGDVAEGKRRYVSAGKISMSVNASKYAWGDTE